MYKKYSQLSVRARYVWSFSCITDQIQGQVVTYHFAWRVYYNFIGAFNPVLYLMEN